MEIAMWPYPGPWAVADPLEAPRPDEGYWAVALNPRPELVGKGLGIEFARAVGVRRRRGVDVPGHDAGGASAALTRHPGEPRS